MDILSTKDILLTIDGVPTHISVNIKGEVTQTILKGKVRTAFKAPVEHSLKESDNIARLSSQISYTREGKQSVEISYGLQP